MQAPPVDGTELTTSIREVAQDRGTRLTSLSSTLDGYGAIGQQRWEAWWRKQRLEDRLPDQFGDVIAAVAAFADPAITRTPDGSPGTRPPANGPSRSTGPGCSSGCSSRSASVFHQHPWVTLTCAN
jgi:hypothetical protein